MPLLVGKISGPTASAFINSAVTAGERIADDGSVFTAEIFGITSAIADIIANGAHKVSLFLIS